MRRIVPLLMLATALVVGACGSSATTSPGASSSPSALASPVFASDEPSGSPSTSASPAPASLAPDASAAPSTRPATGKTYKVKLNDTMWGIAQKFHISVEKLQAANPKVKPTTMRVGTVLKIPAP